VIAHVGGLPLEETLAQLAPAGAAALVAAGLLIERARAWARSGSRLPRTVLAALSLGLAAGLALAAVAAACPDPGHGAATITGSFSDGCRDFAARSRKDISYVELHYVDGRVVKRERINRRHYSIDGGAGDELDFAVVKSGTTKTTFACPRTNGPPSANLEILGPCDVLGDGTLSCDADQPRSGWIWSRPGNGLVFWGCNDDQFCSGRPTDPGFRGIGSTDPDGDIVSWSLDFGDGAVTGGSWTADPPAEVVHAYPPFPEAFAIRPTVTLTVTDSAGQSDSDAMTLEFIAPD
jgi:PKD domain